MGRLRESVEQAAPRGLQEFGDWPTLYPGLTQLPEPARASWFTFDQFYSNAAFVDALPVVFARSPRHIVDVGGNTGAWALACAAYDPSVRMTIVDLPEQIAAARAAPCAARRIAIGSSFGRPMFSTNRNPFRAERIPFG